MVVEKTDALRLALREAALEHGLELVATETAVSAGRPIFRVYLEPDAAGRAAGEGRGIGIDTLAAANEWVAPLVDELGPFRSAWSLELSSPGIDRLLTTPEHFCRFAGEHVRLRSAPIDGRSNWSGRLVGFENDEVLLELEDGNTQKIAFALIKKARVEANLTVKD